MKPLLPATSLCFTMVFLAFPSRADIIADWNNAMLEAIRNESTAAPLAARNLAILHAAIYDAVNAIEPGGEPYFGSLTPEPGASAEAAAVGAAHECLAILYPSQTASFDGLLERYLADTPATSNRADGLTLGQGTALVLLSWRSADGSSTTVPYIPGTEPGDWRRTPPFYRPPDLPQWPYVIPFALDSGAQFRPPGPPSLDSARYAADLNQVKDLGSADSVSRTEEQTLIARFWSDFTYTATPPGHWNQIAQNVATNRPATLFEKARLFALLNIALADAGIVAWDAKYYYDLWRPLTAIQQADTDGNPDTAPDPDWQPLLTTPSFPEYVSGHSTFSGAAAAVLAAFCGTDHVDFTVGSDALPGVTRSYDSFAAAAEEIGLSRIYGGIHFLSADLDGLAAGQQVGDYVFRSVLRPLPERPRLGLTRGSPDHLLRILVSGTPGQAYVLQTSGNLREWTPLATNNAPFTFEVQAGSWPARGFYRAAGAP